MDIREDGKPTMQLLLSFPGNINIAQQIGTSYTVFGTLLLNDDNQVRVTALAKQFGNEASEINMAILREWLQGSGVKPVTWSKLVEVLKKCKLDDLAEKIASQFKCATMKQESSENASHLLTLEREDVPAHGSVTSSGRMKLQSSLREHKGSNANGRKANVFSNHPSFQRLSSTEKAQLKDDERKMKRLFGSLVTDTCDSVEKRIPVKKLAGAILQLGAYEPAFGEQDRRLLDEHREEIKSAESVSEIFIILSAYWNYLDFEVLVYVISTRGDDSDEERLQNYNEVFQTFCKCRIFELPLPESGNGTDHKKQEKLSVKLNIREDTPLEQINLLKIKISKILQVNSATLLIDHVDKGCVQLIFLIPKFVAQEIFPLSDEQTSALPKDASVMRLECGDYVFESPEDIITATLGLEDEAQFRTEPLPEKQVPTTKFKTENQDLQFLEACLAGDSDRVQSLLELGVDVNIKTPDGTTAMQCALKEGNLWIVEMLLAAGAQPDLTVKRTAQADTLPKKVCRDRHQWYRQGGWPLIMRACRRGFPILVENLLAGGVSPNFQTEDGWPALTCACRNGHTKVVEKLLAGGANPDLQTEDGWSPLMTACSQGYLQVVEVLLDGGAHPDLQSRSGWTALMSACRNGSPEIVKRMLAAGAKPDLQGKDGWSALMAASRNGNLGAVEELLNAGAQPNLEDETGWMAHMSASQTGHVEVVEALLKAGAKRDHQDIDGWTALMSASQNGHLEVVEKLLADGSQPDQPDKTGWTALMSACLNNHPKIVEKLLAEGADPDLRNESGQTALILAVHCGSEEVINLLRKASASADIQGKDGVTPLMVAVQHGFSRAVKVLMTAKPDINLQDEEGGTVLFDACKKEDLNIVKFLLKEGARVNHKTKGQYWQTPLLIAAIKGNIQIMEELLKAKADPNFVSKEGHGLSPLMLASTEGKLDIVELLLQYGADPNLQNPITGSTPLMLAIEYDRVKVAEKLLSCNVNLHATNKEGKTATDIAHKVNSEVYWELLKRGTSLSSLQSKSVVHCQDSTSRLLLAPLYQLNTEALEGVPIPIFGRLGQEGDSQLFEQLLKALIQRLQKDRQIMELIVPVQEKGRIPEKKTGPFDSSRSVAVGVYN